jgi:hypothetical protein
MGVQTRLAGFGDGVELAVAIDGDDRLADLFQVGQGRIDHAGTGCVEAAGTFLKDADQLVAVGRLFGEQRQQHESEVGGAKLAGAWEAVAHEAMAEAAASAVAKSTPAAVVANGAEYVVEGEVWSVCIVKHIL